MQTEYERKILDIDVDTVISKLEKLGAEKIAEKFQKRYIYDFTPKKEQSRVRLRTDGTKTTLTIKEVVDDTIEGTKELEIDVDDFETTNQLLTKLGYNYKYYQENKRISYKLGDVEIEIDSRPQIPTYLEIEAKSVEAVKSTIEKLGFDYENTTSITTKKVYKQYGIDLHAIKELKFEDPGVAQTNYYN